MPNMTSLNEEQRTAVEHGTGPLLIIAGAGTGKTTVITQRIQHLILEKDVSPSNILALTFTEKAAAEMETRIDQILPYGYTQMWIETFHAFCDRILRQEAINIGLNPGYDLLTEAEALLFLRKNLFKFELDYFRPLGNPMKFLQGMLQHFSRLKDDDITPEQYLKYAQEISNPKFLIPNEKQDRLTPNPYTLTPEQIEAKKTLELANAFKTYEDLKAKEGKMDFSDLISNVLKLFRSRKNILEHYQNLFHYILVDEFQDTNYAQNEMAILLAGEKQNITVVGDDDQCLPGNTLITMSNGNKKIAEIREGETVMTAVGKGALGIATVKKVFRNKKMSMFITITTKSGAKVTATDNHKMFCYVPKQVLAKNYYYVYLMYRKNLGWRLGVTNDLAVRLKLERSADAIIGLRAFSTAEDARYHELLWSLQYRIPTCIFKERDGVMLQGELVKKLYQKFDTEANAKQLAQVLGINLENYHYVLDAVNRGQSKRIIINVYQCYRNYTKKRKYKNDIMVNPLISHQVLMETSVPHIPTLLEKHGITYEQTKKGIRVRYSSKEIDKVYEFAKQLAEITGGFVEMKSVIGTLKTVNMPALIMPAGNLLEGLSIPIVKNHHVYYDEIISIERKKKTQIVYDLEIDKTHNFIANGIVVHNSIYRWRGAAIANMMQFRSHFPKANIVALTQNYRSTQTILDSAYQLIQNNNPDRLEVKEKINKRLVAMRTEILPHPPTPSFIYAGNAEEEAEEVAKKIRDEVKKNKRAYKDFAILVRANDHALPFQRALDRLHIPYQFLGPGHLFQQEEIKDLIAYLHALANFEDAASLYRILTLPIFDVEARDVAAMLNFAKRTNVSLFEAMERVETSMVTSEGQEKIKRIVDMLKRHLERVPRETAGQILYYFFEDSGLLGYYLDPRSARTEKEAQNIAKFFEKMQSFATNHEDASVFAVVDWIDLSMELGESPMAAEVDWTNTDAVNILTIHSSKGLEFPVVFVVNLVTLRFPSRDRKEQIPVPQGIIRETLPEGNENLQEERRLFYVAITRAQDTLFLSAAKFYGEGKRERKISPFVIETLGEEAINTILKKQKLQQSVQQLTLLDMFNTNIKQEQKTEKNGEWKMRHFEEVSALVVENGKSEMHPVTYISYSQLQTFLSCPLHYKLRYIMNVPTPPSPALNYGISVHSSLRDFFQQISNKEPVNASDMHAILKKNWIRLGYSSKVHEEQAYRQADTMLFTVAEQTLTEKPNTIAIELPFNFWLSPQARGLKVGGRIDRVDQLPDGRIEIIDYKTGNNVPDEKKIKADLQLSFYALAATQIREGIFNKTPEEVVLTLYYVEPNKRISTVRTKADLEIAKEKIATLVEQISQSSFHCNGGIFCKNCEYKMLCSTYRD